MSFDSYVAEQLHGRKSDVFWGFQGSCHDSLKAAKASGKIAVCELATAHVTEAKRILGEEAQLHPEWADSIDNLVFPAHYEQRLAQEPHLADKVVAASAFTKQTLIAAQIPENKIITLPLGAAIDHVPFQLNSQDKISKRPLKLLYAGTVTQRKGIKYLLEAMKLLEKGTATLEIVGGVQGSGQAFRSYSGYEYRAAVSQMELFQMYRDYDALVLPTVFEGFGLVIVEAMAAGLPVITTSHSIGPDLIKNNENGYIVPIRDTPALVKAIEALRRKSDDEYLAMRVAARQSAEQYSWETYQQRLKLILEKIC
jgi:starch synthase